MALSQVGLERLNTATTKKIGTSKNLIFNGAMQVAQRGTSSTSTGYQTVDRFQLKTTGVDAAPTQAQVDVASGTSPYTSGFRKAYKITNGNQTGGAGAGDRIIINYKFEAQDIANSGWNYTDPNSFITLSFWVKSSVAQNFFGYVLTQDGTQQCLPFETGSLSADTWTKITKTIPGNSNLTFDNNNDSGLEIEWIMFRGTNFTGSVSLNAWAAFNSSVRTPDNTSTWYTTNSATWELTGVQVEVGSVATDFEHKSYGDTLWDCQRYCSQIGRADSGEDIYTLFGLQAYGTSAIFGTIGHWPRQMRAKPTVTLSGVIQYTNSAAGAVFSPTGGTYNRSSKNSVGSTALSFGSSLFVQGGFSAAFAATADGANYIQGDAEL